jgi:dihydroxyacid dehydratase/phosphogluconate dehydratase
LICAPLFFVYGSFRAHGGEAFSAVVLKMQEGRGHGEFKMFYSLWAWDLTLS